MLGANNKSGIIRIAVVEDELSVCELVSKHIDTLENCKVIIQAAEGQELLDKLKEHTTVDLAILDVVMDGMDGYTTAAHLSQYYPGTKILFYSAYKTEIALSRMAACGGCGLIQKGEGIGQFKKAITAVLSGKYFFPDYYDRPINMGGKKKGLKPANSFSDTELALLQYACTELTYKEIASRLDKEIRQIEYVREGLFKKLNVKSRTGLVLTALESGLRPPLA